MQTILDCRTNDYPTADAADAGSLSLLECFSPEWSNVVVDMDCPGILA